jgi:hypothetical protein
MQAPQNVAQMFLDRPQPARVRASQALLCLLLAGLLLHGQAQVLRHLLGAAHWHALLPVHTAPAASLAHGPAWTHWLADLRGLHQQVLARSPLAGGHAAHGHHHDTSARHHHGPDDATVVALEPLHDRDAGTPDGGSGSVLQPLGLAAGLVWRLPETAAARWPAALAPGWRDANLRLPERPPRV